MGPVSQGQTNFRDATRQGSRSRAASAVLGRSLWYGTHQPNVVPSCVAATCPAIPSSSGYGSHPGPSASGFHALPAGDTFHSGIGRKGGEVRRQKPGEPDPLHPRGHCSHHGLIMPLPLSTTLRVVIYLHPAMPRGLVQNTSGNK